MPKPDAAAARAVLVATAYHVWRVSSPRLLAYQVP